MEYALQLLLPILLGFYLGAKLDEQTGRSPWFTLGGLILGVVLGIGVLYKRALLAQEKLAQQRRESRDKASPAAPPNRTDADNKDT